MVQEVLVTLSNVVYVGPSLRSCPRTLQVAAEAAVGTTDRASRRPAQIKEERSTGR